MEQVVIKSADEFKGIDEDDILQSARAAVGDAREQTIIGNVRFSENRAKDVFEALKESIYGPKENVNEKEMESQMNQKEQDDEERY